MSSVPYTFENDTGNIPLSYLDTNFANVKGSSDYVIANAQANITSVGTLTSLSVSGNISTSGNVSIVGNVIFGNISTNKISATGNIDTSANVSATGNVTGANIITSGYVSATGNTTAGNVLTGGLISATGNLTGGNIITTGVSSRYIDVSVPAYANITATGTYSLSITNSINILIANNTGYTATLNMPTSPSDGQICNFAIHGNTVTLAVGTGTVLPTFAGSTTVGTGYRYVYRVSDTSWYRIG
jgi:hypothetical protein